jgi:hypothetical protein
VFDIFRRQRAGDGHARLHYQKPDGILPKIKACLHEQWNLSRLISSDIVRDILSSETS